MGKNIAILLFISSIIISQIQDTIKSPNFLLTFSMLLSSFLESALHKAAGIIFFSSLIEK